MRHLLGMLYTIVEVRYTNSLNLNERSILMAKRKLGEELETAVAGSQDTLPANEPPTSSEGRAAEAPPKSKWAPKFGIFGDYEAGVCLIEPRHNRRMTIQFQDKPFSGQAVGGRPRRDEE